MKKRIISILLTLCVVMCLVPTGTFATGKTAGQNAAIQFGTSRILSPTKVTNGKNVHFVPNSYIYFGINGVSTLYGVNYTAPIKWRVLDAEKACDGKTNGMFLLSEYLLAHNVEYKSYIFGSNKYDGSAARGWCRSFAAGQSNGIFTDPERDAMRLVAKTDKTENLYGWTWGGSGLTDGDNMFCLSVREAIDYIGNYDNAPGLAATDIDGNSDGWWLRSHIDNARYVSGIVSFKGLIDFETMAIEHSARPAFNLDTSDVQFISAAAGGKSAKGMEKGLTAIPSYSGNEWKLTLRDTSRSSFLVSTSAVTTSTDGGTVKIEYTGAKTGDNEYVSAILLDENNNPICYGRSMQSVKTENGTAEFAVPAGLAEGEYTLSVFSEQYNGDYKTDYVGNFFGIRFTVEKKIAEQFNFTPGEKYYFDLSGMNIPGTVNDALPDSTLHYVPFTYTGTVNSYVLKAASDGVPGSSGPASRVTNPSWEYGYTYPHSLFIADYTVTERIGWDRLNEAGFIFGKEYQSGDISYTLRAPTVGSNRSGTAGSENERGTPLRNEWDTILDKNSGFIKNWAKADSWGQDTSDAHAGAQALYRAYRGFVTARTWNDYPKGDNRIAYRPVLEVRDAAALGKNALRAVTLDLGGSTLDGENSIKIVVKSGKSFTAPTSAGLPRPDGNSGDYFVWLGSNNRLYAPGDSVPETVTSLTAHWEHPEEFSLAVGKTYYFDLSGENIPGTVDGALPDTTLHYVPFVYVGSIDAYKLKPASSGVIEAAERASETDDPDAQYGFTGLHSLFIADRTVSTGVSWTQLDEKGLIFGKNYTASGVDYTLRVPSMGSHYDERFNDLPTNNEWEKIVAKNADFIKNMEIPKGGDLFLYWGQDTRDNGPEYRVLRYFTFLANMEKDNVTDGAYRPVLEIQNADALGRDGLKAVTLNLAGGTLNGEGSISLVVKNGVSFIAPAKEGLNAPDPDTAFIGWSDGTNTYAPGDSVPSTVTALTAKWEKHIHCLCGGKPYDGHDSHTDITWQPWTATDSLPTIAGNYYLVNDVTLPADTVTLHYSVNICLNGKSVRGADIGVTELKIPGGTLSITDCGTTGNTEDLMVISDGSKLAMYGGKITENTFLRFDHGTSFLMTGNAVNEGEVIIDGNTAFTMEGNAENKGTISLGKIADEANIVFRGHAEGGTVEIEPLQDYVGISVEGNASIDWLEGTKPGTCVLLTMKDNAEIGKVEKINFRCPQLSGNTKLGSTDSSFGIKTDGKADTITVKDHVQLFGTVTVYLEKDEKFVLGDKASVTGELIVMNPSATGYPAKVVMMGESTIHGKLTCADDAFSFEMQDGALIDGDIDVGDSEVNGKVTCTGNIIGGIFNGEVVNNGKIIGGIFYGTVTGTGTIEDSAKRTVSFNSAGGSAVDDIKVLRGQRATAPADPTKTGHKLLFWLKGNMPYDFATPVLDDLNLTAKWTVNNYTITVKRENGENDIVITQNYGTAVTAPTLTRTGYTFMGWDSEFPTTMPAENMTITARWQDIEKPTGEIKIGENRWNNLLNKITFGLFFKETQTVTITSNDKGSGIKTVEYLLSDKELTETELANATFTAYTGSFNIDPDNEYIVYAKLTDKEDNVAYICSDGVVLDARNPVIGGIENGKIYCEAQMVKIDEKYIDTVTVNGTAVTLDENNSFLLTPADGEQKIGVTDKAGNSAEMTVTVNDGHTFGEWVSNGDGTYTRKCTVGGCTAGVEMEKLPDDQKSPQTGDGNNLMLWMALMFISGGVCTVFTVKDKKIAMTRR